MVMTFRTNLSTSMLAGIKDQALLWLDTQLERLAGPLAVETDPLAESHHFQAAPKPTRDATQPPPATPEMISHREMVF